MQNLLFPKKALLNKVLLFIYARVFVYKDAQTIIWYSLFFLSLSHFPFWDTQFYCFFLQLYHFTYVFVQMNKTVIGEQNYLWAGLVSIIPSYLVKSL